MRLKYVHENGCLFLENSWNFRKIKQKIFSISHQTVRTVAAQSAKFSFLHYSSSSSSSSSSSYTTMSGIDCTEHSTCAGTTEYCASVSGDTSGRCRPCEECAQFSDGITGNCPAVCGSDSSSDGEQFTAEQFFNAYTYWKRVKDEGFSVTNKGCESSANAATSSTSGSLKGRTEDCAPVFTKKDGDKWCDVEDLTLTHPFRSCIANEANDYCGIDSSSVCIADGYFDCCPIEKGPVAGVALTIILILIALQYLMCKTCHRRKLIAGADTWTNPKLVRDATIVIEKNPKLTQKIVSKKESRATASENRV